MVPHERLLDEILALDLLTLRRHTEAAGDKLDAEAHRRAIAKSLALSELLVVRRDDTLVAYALLQPQTEGRWFVTGFGTHPVHRNASTVNKLLVQLIGAVERLSIEAICSNVYKTNRLSMAFHERLGFKVTRENGKGVQFDATVDDLRSNASLTRMSSRLRRATGIGPQPAKA